MRGYPTEVRLQSPTSGSPVGGLAVEQEPLEHLALKASRAYVQDLHRTEGK